MIDHFENFYLDSEDFDTFNNWYEIEGVQKIKELSRQLRTFFNYKTEVIRYRFTHIPYLTEKNRNSKFLTQKHEIESITGTFISLIRSINKKEQTLEQGIHSLFFDTDVTRINQLTGIVEKLSVLLHYFSEEDLYNHPKFLKFLLLLTQNILKVKSCLNAQFNEFYVELGINYQNLETEMEFLLKKDLNIKIRKSKKLFEERLTL